jgi:hypothetical protein
MIVSNLKPNTYTCLVWENIFYFHLSYIFKDFYKKMKVKTTIFFVLILFIYQAMLEIKKQKLKLK